MVSFLQSDIKGNMSLQKKKRQEYLRLLDVQTWLPREQNNHVQEKLDMTQEEIIGRMDWDALQDAVAKCKACDLYKARTNPVFGVGNRQADLLVVGEAPGANEDKEGEPFVGRGGQLLTSMLQAIGLSREEIYIANILKSRPPNNRDPSPEEVTACTPYLLRQIVLIKPKLILAVGRIAAHYLLNTNEAMASLRGREFKYGVTQVPLLVTYHPAYLLRSPREKSKAWQDMKLVAQMLSQIQSA